MVSTILEYILILLLVYSIEQIRNYVIDIAMEQYKRDRIIIEQIQSMLVIIEKLENKK